MNDKQLGHRVPKDQTPVWIHCRAKSSCKGNYAVLVFDQEAPNGGLLKRYRCLTCGGTFHIAVGSSFHG